MTIGAERAGGPRLARLVAATAANLAGWHDANLRALGCRTAWADGWWLSEEEVPAIFFAAIAVRPGADPAVAARLRPMSRWLAICDPWSDVDLAPSGFTAEGDRPWMVRPPSSAVEAAPPAGLRIRRVTDAGDLATYERTEAIGFEAAAVAPGTWHAPEFVADPRQELWLGEHDGDPVATANGFAEAGVQGIFSVATVRAARRRGFASALTAHTVGRRPELAAVLQPSPMAEPMYRRLGFERFAAFRTWTGRSP